MPSRRSKVLPRAKMVMPMVMIMMMRKPSRGS